MLIIVSFGLISCGSSGSSSVNITPIEKIKAYAENSSNPKPTLQDYTDVGVTGVTVENLDALNALVESKKGSDVDTIGELDGLIVIIVNNHAPLAEAKVVTVTENTENNSIILSGTDEDGNELTYSIITQPTHGILTLSGNIAKYTPTTDYEGLDSFIFKSNDKITDSESATVSITVTKKIVPIVGKPWDHGKLKVSADKRMLQHEDETGFFWLADTAWFAPAKMTREEMDMYLTNRAEKGFSVIQINVMSLVWHRNAYGDFPFPVVWDDDDKDENGKDIKGTADNREAFKIDQFLIKEGNEVPTEEFNRTLANFDKTPLDHDAWLDYIHKFENDKYDYWDNVGYMIDKAAEKGIYIAMIVSWGGHVKDFIKEDRAVYEKYITDLTTLYKDRPNLIWLNGGDVYNKELMMKEQWNWIGETLKATDPNHLVSFHGNPASFAFKDKSWLDFYIVESGHGLDITEQNKHITDDYNLDKSVRKPTLDAETRYEEMTPPIANNVVRPKEERIVAKNVREIEYYQLFSGAFGVTYGHNSIWQVSWQEEVDKTGEDGYAVRIHPLQTWDKSLNTPGAFDMQYLGKLMRSRPILGRVPDQSLIVDHEATAKATVGDGYAMVYTTSADPLRIALGKVSGTKVHIWSYNPRTGEAKSLVTSKDNNGIYTFTPESGGEDWVVVIDDISKNYKAPGA